MPYADLDNLIADYIPGAKSEKETNAIERILDSVSAFVDSYCKRKSGYFAPAEAESSMKRIRGEGENFLRLPAHVFGSIESVTVGGVIVETNSYYESDKNGWLYFEDESFCFGDAKLWEAGRIYKVNARWGHESTPLEVAEAVRLITARIWSTQRGTIGQVTAEGFIQERLIPAAAKDLLKPFIRRQFEI